MDQPMQPLPQEPSSEQQPFNKQFMINAIVVAQLVILLVFGYLLYTMKQELAVIRGNAMTNNNRAVYQGPIVQEPTAPERPKPTESAGPVTIKIRSTDHIRGNEDAPVTIVEYSDFQCVFCARAQSTLNDIFEIYGDQVRLVYRHFTLANHARAVLAAEASECAANQGKFWEMHDTLFENQPSLTGGETIILELAEGIGLEMERFSTCLDEHRELTQVRNGKASGSLKGVSGTPAFFFNGHLVSGNQPLTVFQDIIESELEKLNEEEEAETEEDATDEQGANANEQTSEEETEEAEAE